ncbi:MAG: IS1380 family transposase [Phycisphaeraceae bacterium]|nr:IS1380 family transposase [Phycisphaeraceae bacterium]
MSLQGARQLVLGFLPGRPVVLETSAAQLSSDGGLLIVREFDERLGFTARFSAALADARKASCTYSLLSMVRQRIYGVLADYEDQNDHDELRSDPVFKLIADRLPDDPDLASQPTLSRFENAVTIADLKRLREELAQQFLDGFERPPGRITLDVDAFDDPTHGQQQLTFFHGYYEQHQYLPIAVTCAENDAVTLVGLRHGTAHPALGADDDLRFLAARIRARWPDGEIVVRGDSGYGVQAMYDVCEELGLTDTFGLGMNPRLQRESDELLAQAVAQYEATGQKQRLFLRLWYQAETWPAPRLVIVKCEAHAQGTNRRAIVTNRPGAALFPEAAYDEYAARGESENRNKELKRGLGADRLSDHRFLANFFRLFLHAAALNLLVRLRRATAKAPTPAALGVHDAVPATALPERSRKRFFNRRRQHDPLGEGHADTWRSRCFKVAVEVLTSTRRVLVRLPANWPHLDEFFRVGPLVATHSAPGTS